MQKEIITVPKESSISEILKNLKKKLKTCWIYLDERLLNKENLEELNPKGVFSLEQDGCSMILDSDFYEEDHGCWLLWCAETKKIRYHIPILDEEAIHLYIKIQ